MFSIISNLVMAETPTIDLELVRSLKKNQIRLIVIRHGEAVHNLTDLMCSSRSPGVYLTKRGMEQVQAAALRLESEKINAIYVSPVYRTLQTSHIIAETLKIPHNKMHVEEDLREQYFGIFEECTYDEYEGFFADKEQVYTLAVPDGESGEESFNRTKAFLNNLPTKHQKETILLVTHGFNCCHISKCLTDTYTEVPSQAEFTIYDFKDCGLD